MSDKLERRTTSPALLTAKAIMEYVANSKTCRIFNRRSILLPLLLRITLTRELRGRLSSQADRQRARRWASRES